MNKWIGTGRLTKDPEIRWTAGENKQAVANFGLAVDRRIRKAEHPEADFFNCVAFGKTAEIMEKYWKKGMKAAVSGRIQNDSFEGKEGQKVTQMKIYVDEIEFCEKKQEQAPAQESAWSPVGDEDLPFKF